MLAALAAVSAARPPAPDWSGEVVPALDLYRSGDCAAAQELSQRLALESKDALVRHEAAAVRAMCLLCGPSRDEWASGLAELARLEQVVPGLTQRAECLLAAGRAHLALYQTAMALRLLDEAARKFAAQAEYDRAREALVSLAQAWSVHNEWEVTPTQFGVERPQSPQSALPVRRAQIARVRQRLAELPNAADDLARVDLILARLLLSAAETAPEGRALLEELAASGVVTPSASEGLLLLGELYEQEGRSQDALRLYRQVAEQGTATAAATAANRLSRLVSPQLELEVPEQVRSDAVVSVSLRARNLQAVELEVRRVDLPAFLAARRGMWSEAALPTSGSVVFSRRLDTQTPQAHQWWRSDQLSEALEFRADPGAYVVLATASERQGSQLKQRRLVLISDLVAYACAGPQRVLVCVGPAGPGAREVNWQQADVSFWMAGSFVPTRLRCTEGVAQFPVPPEGCVLRDKRWLLLAQADGHFAICRGQLPRPEEVESGAVALAYAPAAVRVGGVLTLAGVLLEPGCDRDPGPVPLELELRDTLEQLVLRQQVTAGPTGVFCTQVSVPGAWAGQEIRVSVSRNKKTLPIVDGRLSLRVEPADRMEAVLTADVPSHVLRDDGEVNARMAVFYPWGAPVAASGLRAVVRGVALPAEANGWRPGAIGPYVLEAHDHGGGRDMIESEGPGRFHLSIPLSNLQLPVGPTGLGMWLFMTEATGRGVVVPVTTLVGSQPVYPWLTVMPQPARVGDEVSFTVGWFDSTGRSALTRPVVHVRGKDVEDDLGLHLTPLGLQSDLWVAAQPGSYEVSTTLLQANGSTQTISRQFEVLPAAGPVALLRQAFACVVVGQPGVQVCLSGSIDAPLAVVVSDAEPRGGALVPSLAGDREVFVPTSQLCCGAAAELVVLGQQKHAVGRSVVEAEPHDQLTLELSTPSGQFLPGQVVHVDAVCREGSRIVTDATLVACLVSEAGTGPINWIPLSLSEGAAAASDVLNAGQRVSAYLRLPAALRRARIAGACEWLAVRPTGRLDVPLPQNPGTYRLKVLAAKSVGRDDPSCRFAEASLLLDTRGGLEAWIDVPARCTVGDRFAVTAGLRRPAGPAVPVELVLDAGQGLAVELPCGGPVLLPAVSPAAPTWFSVRAEATRPGAGVVAAKLAFDGLTQVVRAPYEVVAADARAEAGAAFLLKRSVFVLTAPPDAGAADSSVEARRGEIPLSSGDRVFAGQELLVREVFALAEPLADVSWSQRLPPNCLTTLTSARVSAQVGGLVERRADGLRFQAAWLESGTYVHEYVVVAGRPGVCVFPAPTVSAQGRPLAVNIEPVDLRINVLEATPGHQ